ncbi:MAG: beta-ketoacyl-[acyl-carrier-protein] synthase family protein [Betaproteobacteria bacterium]|nr:MAG: beta-ketoacyl-[acyl-carrier-protein] synthase family protein [Betaproteobacteria bacterium]
MAARRVAVTGAGVVSPLGKSLAEFHAALAEGRSGIRRLPESLAQGSGVQVGALVDWNPAPLFNEAEAVNIDRVSQFALAAAAQALAASRLDLSTADRDRLGVYWGTGMGGAHTLEGAYKNVYGGGEWRVRPLTVVMTMNNAAGSNVAVRHGLRGPFANFSTACSSSAMALGEAMRSIMAGRADAIVAGGAEALLTPGTLAAWQALRTLAPADAADPAASCKPFDKRRAGLVLGEGAAAFVLEEESRARARGAPIHALLTAYGNSCDAAHMSRPDRDGQVRAMREALIEAGLEPNAIGYINAHGTATAVGDVVEAEAINVVFGAAANDVPVSSTKSLHGHLLGGAGALEFAVALLALEKGVLAPTAFLEQPDPACRVRHVRLRAERVAPPRAVMSNSFAFGGSNVVLIAERA